MKKYTRAICLALIAALVCAAGFALAEGDAETVNDQLFITPAVVARESCYREVDLTETDIAQGQVAAYESDSPDYPDIDVYLFDSAYRLDEYAKYEAQVFSATVHSLALNEKDAWIYVCSELYDGEWFIVSNLLYEANETQDQEVCLYDKTQSVTVDGSDLCVHIPVAYHLGEKTAEDYVAQSYTTARETVTENLSDPYAIDTVYVEDALPKDLVVKIAEETGLDFEYVTINGRSFYVLFGKTTDGEGNACFVKTYLFNGENGTSGIRFTYTDESNGFDNAVMFTSGF